MIKKLMEKIMTKEQVANISTKRKTFKVKSWSMESARGKLPDIDGCPLR
jgi:hypothetical protein